MRSANSIEFRIPISPTRSFFHQVRFYESTLRKLGGVYASAKLTVIVGDNADMERVRAENDWSAGRNVEWIGAPTEVFNRYGYYGTADYRYAPESEADLIILSDADTVIARPLDLFERINPDRAVVAGHMAHYPPWTPGERSSDGAPMWDKLFAAFGIDSSQLQHRYSMDVEGAYGSAPPYFNLGFIALTQAALERFRNQIWNTQDRLLAIYPSHMRCQISVTLVALSSGMEVSALPAEYNLANDELHLRAAGITAEQARVIHYLRSDELNREFVVLPEHLPAVLRQECKNPINQRLQELLGEYARIEFGIEVDTGDVRNGA